MTIVVEGAGGPNSLLWWDWVADHTDDIWVATLEHLRLTVIAVSVGFAISLGLATVAVRFRSVYGPLAWVAGILYTVPSVGLFAFLVGVTGTSTITAEVGLVSYTLLLFLRNIVSGLSGVPRAVKQTADAMGYTRWRRFVAVDLRLATPAIIAGFRIASVSTIGLVTVTALVGFGGYGSFIEDGLDRSFPTPIVVGASLSIVMAIVLDLILAAANRLATPWAQRGPA